MPVERPSIALGKDGKVFFWGTYIKEIEGGISFHLSDGQVRATYINGVVNLPGDDLSYEVDKLWEGEVPYDVLWKPAHKWLANFPKAIEWIENEISKTRS